MIVTHVDRDHIDGVIRALRDQHLHSADIWFNGRDEIDALVEGSTRGVRQGDELSALIPADRRNRVVDGQAIHVPLTGPVRFELPGGAGCTLLSPSRKRLERLLAKWPDPLRVVDDATEDLLNAAGRSAHPRRGRVRGGQQRGERVEHRLPVRGR